MAETAENFTRIFPFNCFKILTQFCEFSFAGKNFAHAKWVRNFPLYKSVSNYFVQNILQCFSLIKDWAHVCLAIKLPGNFGKINLRSR